MLAKNSRTRGIIAHRQGSKMICIERNDLWFSLSLSLLRSSNLCLLFNAFARVCQHKKKTFFSLRKKNTSDFMIEASNQNISIATT